MAVSEAEVVTAHAGKYIQQLCKHWSHKFPVESGSDHGRIDLGDGRSCLLQSSPDTLKVRAEAVDEAALPRLEQVIADHIKRFAFREELAFEWRPAPGPAA